MAIINNKQYSPPWGSMPYAGETYAAAGCGATACSDAIGYKPNVVGSWLEANNYTAPHSGTYWGGIPAALQHFGIGASELNFSNMYGVKVSAVFDKFRKHIESGYCGCLLMGKGYWTQGGHYIFICGFKDGQYRVYDPASTVRDGYHPWSAFEGMIKIAYTMNLKWQASPEPAFKPTGTATCTDNGVNIRAEATTSAIIRGTLNVGQRFEIDGTMQNGYVHCRVANIGVGWIAAQYVKRDTPEPTPTYAYSFSVPALYKGKNSRAVTLFERLLAPKNIYKGTSDTIYGDGCVAACKKVQALRNMTQTGDCLLAEWVIITGLPHEGSKFFLTEVKGGSQGASVVFVQLILKAFGIYTGAVDGVASKGGLTIQAIKEFQERFKLPQTGIADKDTLKAIVGF